MMVADQFFPNMTKIETLITDKYRWIGGKKDTEYKSQFFITRASSCELTLSCCVNVSQHLVLRSEHLAGGNGECQPTTLGSVCVRLIRGMVTNRHVQGRVNKVVKGLRESFSEKHQSK